MSSRPITDDDLDLLLANEFVEELEAEDEEDEDAELAFLAAFILGGAAEAQQMKHDARRRRYLRRAELLPDPQRPGGTPWQRLYESRNDRAYITTMGIDVATFDFILENGFTVKWITRPIKRSDIRASATPRPRRRSLDAAGALGLVLHWLSSSMSELGLQQIFALTPASVDRYLRSAINILLETLNALSDAKVVWPTPREMREYSDIITQRHPLLIGAFGTVDGLNLPVQVSQDEEIENATYNGWLHEHFVSNIFCFAPKGFVIFCVLNAPGSWHDARVARELYELLCDKTPPNFYLVADTAFPRTAASISNRIRTPAKSSDPIPTNRRERERFQRMNRQLLACRQAAEWGMRDFQGAFGRLRVPLPIKDSDLRLSLLRLVVRIHQLRVRRVGISHIRNYYVPIWRDGDDLTELWFHWEEMLFRDIRTIE
ncbi:hypothetical protein BV20DRAFT_1113454 [Pilatotrama ljubarskyi]|nr:hypothetical protein BV20DRAFT_1113454 [Pilatotrama ljubarskyi]